MARDKFPLPTDFFPTIELSQEQIDQYELIMQQKVALALHHSAEQEARTNQMHWKKTVEMENFVVLTQQGTSAAGNNQLFRLFGNIPGNFRQLLEFFYCDTSQEVFELNQFMANPVVDARVLLNLWTDKLSQSKGQGSNQTRTTSTTCSSSFSTSSSSQKNEYFGIKWVAFQPSLMAKRDMCFLEYSGFTFDKKNREVGFRAICSVDIPQCRDLSESHRVNRMRCEMVHLTRQCEDQSNVASVFVTGAIDLRSLNGNSKSGMAEAMGINAYFKKHIQVMRNIMSLLDSKRISKQKRVSKAHWVPDRLRKKCVLCTRNFHAARSRHHCRLCGEVVCGKCLVVRHVTNNDFLRSKNQVIKEKFCISCITRIRDDSNCCDQDTVRSTWQPICRGTGPDNLAMNNLLSSSMTEYGSYSETDSEASKLSIASDSYLTDLQQTDRWKTDMGALDRLDESHVSLPETEVSASIDTNDMTRVARRSQRYGLHSMQPFRRNNSSTRAGGNGGTVLYNNLEERIAQQEALLQQLTIAANNYSRSKYRGRQSIN